MTKVLILAGGRSGEHEVSLVSAKHILAALDRKKFKPILIVVRKDGAMTLVDEEALEKIPNNPKQVKTPKGPLVGIRPYGVEGKKPTIIPIKGKELEFDIAFPIIHGPGGEDGTIQGLFEFSSTPVVGCGVKASAVCMDKAFTKKICIQAGLPVAPFVEAYKQEKLPNLPWNYPIFVKPSNTGSSIGVSKVKTEAELLPALKEAFQYDDKALIEKAIEGREIEFAVFGNRKHCLVSPAGEIKPNAEFYTYEAKYVDENGADLIYPAKLTPAEMARGQDLAKKVFLALDGRGMARIDFFLTPSGEFLLNEINTIPGFTPISMYPKLMALAGVEYSQLLTDLVELAAAH